MLIVASLLDAPTAYERRRPSRVISLLASDEPAPVFAGLDETAHLKLHVEPEDCVRTIDDAARRRAHEIVAFIEGWEGEGDMLIHCARGVSRSTAAAFIIQCMRSPAADEAALAAALRRAAPHADPCPLLVSYADDLLGRGGRMIEAIEDLPAPAPALAAPLVILPAAP